MLTATILPKQVCNNQNAVKLHVDFDSAWDGCLARSAVFHTSKDPTPYEAILSGTGECTIPHEVLRDECRLFIGVKGSNSASNAIKATTLISYKVLPGTPSVVVSDPTPSVYSQLARNNAVLFESSVIL